MRFDKAFFAINFTPLFLFEKKVKTKALRAFETKSTFFFEKKVAKKQKSLQDLSALSVPPKA